MITSATKNTGDVHRLMVIATAYWVAQNKNRREIARLLRRSQPQVASLISDAKEQGYMSRTPVFHRNRVSAADWKKVRAQFLEQAGVAG